MHAHTHTHTHTQTRAICQKLCHMTLECVIAVCLFGCGWQHEIEEMGVKICVNVPTLLVELTVKNK